MTRSKVDKYYSLLRDLHYQYPDSVNTFSTCSRCEEHSARGGGVCANCIERELAKVIGPTKGAHLHTMIKQLAEHKARVADELRGQSAITLCNYHSKEQHDNKGNV